MRPCIEQSNGPVSLSPFQFWPDCITNTSGYDFRKGQVAEYAPVTAAISAFMMGRDFWNGTAAELLHILSNLDRTEAQPSAWKTWPREASSFGKKLRLATPVLRKIGIEIVIGKASNRRRTRTITLSKIEPPERSHQATRPSDGSDSSQTGRAVTKAA
jgi:hypothetical protein